MEEFSPSEKLREVELNLARSRNIGGTMRGSNQPQQQTRPVHALVSTSRTSALAAARTTSPATSASHYAMKDKIKTPPSRSSAPVVDARNARNAATALAPPAALSALSATSSPSLSLKKKVDDVFKRMQPHTIVQSYEKLVGGVRILPSVCINGEVLPPLAAAAPSLNAGWKAQKEVPPESSSNSNSRVLPSSFNPSHGRFHYARSLQYASSDSALSLSTIKSLQVSLTSSVCHSAIQICHVATTLSRKHWHLVAGSSKQIGLALYELPLGDWQSSSLVVLVWAQSLEVVKLYLQLNLAELLHSAVQRPVRIQLDDVDPAYGLHSHVAAITIRSFDRVLWEKELYGIEFPPRVSSAADAKKPVLLTTELLDDRNGYRDRERYLDAAQDAALSVATEAITYAMDNVLIVDVNVWDASCNPIWGFSKPLPILPKQQSHGTAEDFSLSVAGDAKQSLALVHHDASRGNALTVLIEKIGGGAAGKKAKVFVKQIELAFSLHFINATFGTNYSATSVSVSRK